MKKVLILGPKCYFGESLYKCLLQYPDMYNVDIVMLYVGRTHSTH